MHVVEKVLHAVVVSAVVVFYFQVFIVGGSILGCCDWIKLAILPLMVTFLYTTYRLLLAWSVRPDEIEAQRLTDKDPL